MHRNTVVAAYDELLAQGWVHTEEARGTFVSESLPSEAKVPRQAGLSTRAGFPLPKAPSSATQHVPQGVLNLGGGMPDTRILPMDALVRALRRVARAHGSRLMDYGDGRGDEVLRRELAVMLAAQRGVPATADDVLITRGSQMALALIASALFSPGDTIAVEGFGYPPAWEAFARAGLELAPVPVDAEGIDVDALEGLVADRQIAGVYVTPHHQYPTPVCTSAARRLRLLALAAEHRFAIIEDDYDNEIHYRGRPVLPLASADEHGSVIYVGTMSKVIAPGLRIGYVVASAAVLGRLHTLRLALDRQGDGLTERAVAELFEEGEIQRHLNRMRRAYQSRRDALVGAIARELPDVLVFDLPDGGMALWASARGVSSVEAWARRALDAGVAFSTAKRYAFDRRSRPYIRLGFAAVEEGELVRAVRIMARTLPTGRAR